MGSRFLLGLSIGLFGSTGAQAATLSIADIFGPAPVPFAGTVVAISQFDPMFGTLTKVTLTLEANASGGSIAWDNEALVGTDVTLGIGAEVTAVAPNGLTAMATPLQVGSAVGVAADNDGAADFIGTDSFSVVAGSGSDTGSGELAAGLAAYVGLGSFNITVSAAVETFLSTTGGFGPIDPVAGNADGILTVTYEFTPVPEPATPLLLASALVALAVCARLRNPAPS